MTKWLHAIGASLLLSAALLAGCGQNTTPKSGAPLNVIVSILPQQYFVERVGGEHVTVSVMVEPGASPATYEPKPRQLAALSQAIAYFSIGVPFENAWLGKIASANAEMLIVDTAVGIERMPMPAQHHGEEGEGHYAAETLDPHIWLSPELVKIQSHNIYEALAELDPAHEGAYKANLDRFLADVDALESEIHEKLAGVENKKFMVFHPSWGYFARDFGLEMIPIEVGGQEPSAAELARLIEEARAENVKVIFAQPEFSTKAAETIAGEIGGQALLISSLAPDWLDNMRHVANTLAEALDK